MKKIDKKYEIKILFHNGSIGKINIFYNSKIFKNEINYSYNFEKNVTFITNLKHEDYINKLIEVKDIIEPLYIEYNSNKNNMYIH